VDDCRKKKGEAQRHGPVLTLLGERQMEIYLEMVFVKTGKGFRLL